MAKLEVEMALRDYLAARRLEIEAQMKALKVELGEIRIAEQALAGETPTRTPVRGDGSSALVRAGSIKDWIIKALGSSDFAGGLVTDDVIAAISMIGGPEVSRSSITPQLSRLKGAKLIEQEGRHWRLVRRDLPLEDETPGAGTPDVSDEDDPLADLLGTPNPAAAGV